jgi:hypothetical protein
MTRQQRMAYSAKDGRGLRGNGADLRGSLPGRTSFVNKQRKKTTKETSVSWRCLTRKKQLFLRRAWGVFEILCVRLDNGNYDSGGVGSLSVLCGVRVNPRRFRVIGERSLL